MKHASRAAVALLSAALSIGQAAAETLSLREIWELGLRGNADWAAAGHDLEGIRLGVERARADRGPSLSLLSRLTKYSEPHLIRIPAGVIDENPREFSMGAESTYQISLYLTQDVYTGGATAGRIAMARGDHDAGVARREEQREALLLSLTRSVADLLKSARVLDVLAEERKLAQAHLERARGFLENHQATRLDVLEAQVRLSEVDRKLLVGRNAADLAIARLNRLLGRPLETPIGTAADLPFQDPLPELEEARRTALSRRPELAALRGIADRSLGHARAAASQYRPRVSLFGTFTQGYDPTFLTSDTRFWTLGAALSWSLWDSGRRGLDLRRANASTRAAEARIRSAEEEISLEVLAAHRRAQEKEAVLRSLESARDAVQESLRLARERYAEGLGRSLDVLDAQTSWARTETDYQLARLDAQLARAELLHATGTLSLP